MGNTDYLTANGLANSYITVLFFFGIGIISALDTLVSQAHGAKQDEVLPTLLLRSVIIVSVVSIPIMLMHLVVAEYFFIAIRTEPQIVTFATRYTQWMTLTTWPNLISRTIIRYLQAQDVIILPTVALIIVIVINVPISYFFMYGMFGFQGIGFIGSAIGVSICTWIQLALTIVVLIFHSRHLHARDFFNIKDALRPAVVWQFIKLAIPGSLMMVLEILAFEVTTVLTAVIGTLAVAGHTSMLNLSFVCLSPY